MTIANNSPIRLGDLCVVDVAGDDAETFLQGQFCNDLTAVTAPGAQLTGYCSPKGRLLATPLIVRVSGGIRLVLPVSIVEATLKRLRMFVMRADVTFTTRDDLAVIGVFDPADPLFATMGAAPPQQRFEAMEVDDVTVTAWSKEEAQRWLAIVPLSSPAVPTNSDSSPWTLADIRAGIPAIVATTQERFIPQMLNFTELGGLSFTKGCYPGQEIVARTRYLGKLKKHMQRFVGPGPDVPSPGDILGESGSTETAEVVNAVLAPDGSVELLAVVRIERAEAAIPLNGGLADVRDILYPPRPGDDS